MADIQIEVVYALPDQQKLLTLQVEENCTIEQALKQSGILESFPEIDLAVNKVGIFSRVVKLDEQLREGDRIEIYRPLIADPKEARKKKAEKNQ